MKSDFVEATMDRGPAETTATHSETTYVFPASFSQRRLWFLQQLEPGQTSYLVPVALRLNGPLDVAAATFALNRIVERHDTMRTSFEVHGGEPVQVVRPYRAFEITVEDLAAASDPAAAAQASMLAEANTAFDLAVAPLWRYRILRLSAEEHILLFTTHHIVFDGWSKGVWMREFSAFYRERVSGELAGMSELPIQYGDYAAWQREQLSGKALDDQLSFWSDALEGAPTLLELPTDRPRLANPSQDGATVPFALDKKLTRDLRKMCRETNSTPFMVLLAAFQVLLSRYSGQHDILVGSPIANRERLELEGLIGFFTNTLVMRAKIEPDASFLDVLGQVKRFTLDAYAHQDMPFDKLVEHLQPGRNLSYNPLFQVMFALHNNPRETAALEGLTVSAAGAGRLKTKFDLFLAVVDTPESFRGVIEYGTALFEQATVERMLDHYLLLLEAATTLPLTAISHLPLLTAAEERQQLLEWNHPGTACPVFTISEAFEEQAARTPGSTALIFEDREMSYGELNRRANQLAHHLRALGVCPETLVGICVERSLEMLVGILGILKAGGAYVPVDPAYPVERQAFMLEDARVPVLVTQAALAGELHAPNGVTVCLDTDWDLIAQQPDSNPERLAQPGNTAYVIYTSGTTGRPKGVMITHANVARLFTATDHWFSFSGSDTWTLFHSFAFDFSVWEIWGALFYGGRLVVVPRITAQSPEQFHELLVQHKVTVLNQTPSAFRQLISADERSGRSCELALKWVIFGGEALEFKTLLPWTLRHGDTPALINMYGITETTVHVTYYKVTAAEVAESATSLVGVPIPDLQVYILDRNRRLLPAGVTGEMYVGGGGVAREYLNRPELTAERFIPDPFSSEPGARLYKTGDLGRFRSDGNIQHMGRADSQVKIRGFRIELGEIENTLRRHSAVSDCVVVAREDQPGDKRLVAYIVASVDSTPDVKEIRAHLGSSLPEYMVPAAMMLLDELPLTSSGKIDSKALPAPDYAAGQSDIDGGAPETAVQQIVAAIWSEVLKLDRIALGNDFFQIGGHSLLATQVIARVRQAFGVDVPLRCLFETPTLRDMCAEVDRLLQAGRMSESPALTKVDRSVPLRLSFAQQRFWLMNQLNPNDTGYNVKTAIRMIGALDIAVLQECITEIFSRNEVLRTTYRGTGGVPTQVIQPATPAQLEIVDIEGTSVDEALRIAAVAALKPFDLAAGPVCRFYLYRIGARDHILVMVTHHIAMDGSSTSIVFEDLGNLYSQLCAGERPRLEEKTFDYADFSAWQRQWMQGDVLEEHLSFWRGHLDGLPPHMELPTDRSVETSSGAGDARSFRMSPEFFEQLTEFCRTHRVTQFTVMLWSLGILLHRWSGGKSFAIGTVAGNRPVAGLERVVGCFLNMLPLRMDVHSSDSALDVLARTRATVLDGFSHGQCPFDAIVEAMKVERSAHRNPVFNVGLLLQNFSEMAFVTESLDAKAIGFERETALLDLRFVASIRADKAVIGCEYKRDLFDPETIDLLLEAYATTVQALIADPGMEVGAVPVSPALLAQAENANAEHHQKIIVSATFTAEPIEEPLRFWMRELELNYEIEFAPYNQVFQSLLDPESAMRRNKNGFNVLLVRFEDWAQFDGSGAETARENIRRENIRNSVEELISAVKSAAAGNFATCILCCCPASRSLASDPEWAAFLLEMEEHVASDLIKTSGVHVITSAHLNDMYPVAEYEDKYADAVAHVPYTKAFSTALATIVIRRISGLRGAQYKVVALDCDNTLWQGICGEDGAFGVTIDTPHRALQEFIQKQREQGMLVCLCSKNNEQDVWDVFQQNAGMLLRREDITGHRINWERKSENLKSLAQELGLGLDSFVFLDDSPVECAEVETECPEVLTLQIPEQVHQLPAFLKHMWAFDHFQSTEVDRRRSELYRDNREREELRKGQGLDEFIESLQLEIDIAPLSEENVARVAQLTQRTNQFNFTTIRRQEHEVGEILNMPAMECLTVHVRDRFGDYGLVGAVIYSFDEGSLVVDTMLLSCRALGRRVEHAILDRLGEEARKKNMDRLDMRFSRTAKNTPAFDFLENLQDATKVSEAGGIVYRMGLIGVSENGMDQLVDAL